MARTGLGRGLHLFRFRRREVRVHDRLEAEFAERERMARDVQHTLLQGVRGVIVGFQAAAAAFPEGDPTRQLIESALDRAERDLLEVRRRMALLIAGATVEVEVPARTAYRSCALWGRGEAS